MWGPLDLGAREIVITAKPRIASWKGTAFSRAAQSES